MRANSWEKFKSFVDSRDLSITWFEDDNKYSMVAVDGSLVIEYALVKNKGEEQIDFESNYKDKGNRELGNSNSPFGNKSIGTKNLFRRKHGMSKAVAANSTDTIIFSVPYNQAKITKAELVNCSAGDIVNLTVHDDTSGSYSTIPNYKLNQFGFDVNMPDGMYVDESQYDADLYLGMVVKIEYTNNTGSQAIIGVNITLHELV